MDRQKDKTKKTDHIWPGLDVKWAAPVDQYNQNVIIYR